MKHSLLLLTALVAATGACNRSGTSASNATNSTNSAAAPAPQQQAAAAPAAAGSQWIVGRWTEGTCDPNQTDADFRADGTLVAEGDTGTWRLDGETLTITKDGESRSERIIVRQSGPDMAMVDPANPTREVDRMKRC